MARPTNLQTQKMCQLAFTELVDRVIICPPDERHPSDYSSWVIGLRGHKPEVGHRGLAERWVCRYWKIDPLSPGKDGAMTALVERATLYGFDRIEVFDIEPPPTRPRQREVHELNEKFAPLIKEFNDAIQTIPVAHPT